MKIRDIKNRTYILCTSAKDRLKVLDICNKSRLLSKYNIFDSDFNIAPCVCIDMSMQYLTAMYDSDCDFVITSAEFIASNAQ